LATLSPSTGGELDNRQLFNQHASSVQRCPYLLQQVQQEDQIGLLFTIDNTKLCFADCLSLEMVFRFGAIEANKQSQWLS
jgi:hypothetical protein